MEALFRSSRDRSYLLPSIQCVIAQDEDPSFVSSLYRFFIRVNEYRIPATRITISIRVIIRRYPGAVLFLTVNDNTSDNGKSISLLNFWIGYIKYGIGIQLRSWTIRQVW